MIEEIDQNADGIISEDEFISRSRERFLSLDADGDGQVNKEEVQKHRESMRSKMKERMKERRQNRQNRSGNSE